ncbi:MAG: signal peptidase I [Chitinispirillaceae bacterium]
MENQKQEQRRSEKAGILNFTREMFSALLMAFIAIVYIIQAFRIPTGSMEDSLLVGDFLLGLKFIYGAPVLPFSYQKFPGITDPEPGDVIIFKYPGTDRKDYIKRCIAGPGQTIEITGQNVVVDGKTMQLPPDGKYQHDGYIEPLVANFSPLRIPARGDTIVADTLPIRELLFLKHLIHQEHPRKQVSLKLQVYIDGEYANDQPLITTPFGPGVLSFNQIDFDAIDNWTFLESIIEQAKNSLPEKQVEIRKYVYLQDKVIHRYVVENDNYFMMGDNRDNSMDSRFWGYLNRNFIKAKAFILYFSLDKEVPFYLLPLKIRWNRIGKLIQSWDGLPEAATQTSQ